MSAKMSFVTACLLLLLIDCSGGRRGGSQRYRVTLRKHPQLGLGLRLVKLKSRVIILDIVPESPASKAAGGVLGVGDAIAAVNKVPVPPNSRVNTVQSMIIQGGQDIELIVDKDWQHAMRHSAASGQSGQTHARQSAQTHAPSSSSPSSQFSRRSTWRYPISLTRTVATGFGLRLRKRADTPFIVVDGVVADSVAARLNMIKPNDQIEAIDDRYLVDASLDDVISYLRKHIKVRLKMVVSGSIGPIREHHLNVNIALPKRHAFLGLKLRYSNHNKSIFIERIFRSGVAAKDGRLAVGDNIVAVRGLDIAGEVAKFGEGAVASVLKVFKDTKTAAEKGRSVPIRVKRMVSFNVAIQDRLQRIADEANGAAQHHHHHHQHQQQQHKRRTRIPRFGEEYRAKIQKGPRGIGLKFTTKGSKEHNRAKTALVSSVVPGMPAEKLNLIQTGDSVVSFQGYSMRRRADPISIIAQLASRAPVGSVIDMVFRRESERSRRTPQKGKARRFGSGAASSEERAQTLRPLSVSCEVISPVSLARVFKRSNGNVACAAAAFGPPISDEPGTIGRFVRSEPVHGCGPLVGANDGRFKGAIVVMRRGTCYFNTKAVNAQRAGAVGVVVSQDPDEATLFPMGIDADAATFQPEPVSIPAVMISHKDARILLNATLGSQVRFGLFGNYGNTNGTHDVGSAVPERNPFELMLRFEQGSFDLRMGKPGIVGNPRAKGRRKILTQTVPFSALYRRTKIVVPLKRTELCPVCHGKGGVEGGLKSCPKCGHTEHPGRHVVHDHLGRTCSQQTEKTCLICHGHGEVLKAPKHTCPHCHGHRVVSSDRLLNVTLLPGFPDGHSVLFRNFGDETPHNEPGDIEITVKHQDVKGFVRRGADLHATIHLDLLEALLGFKRSIQLPDNRVVNIERRDKLCAPGTVFTFRGFGLPIFQMQQKQRRRNARRANQFIEDGSVPTEHQDEEEKEKKREKEKSGASNRAKDNYGALVVIAALRPNALETMTERRRKRLRDALKSAPGRRQQQEWSAGSGRTNSDSSSRKADPRESLFDDSIRYTVKEANITNLIRGINRVWFSSAAYKKRSNEFAGGGE
jgi:DnaJ-class molecular chaperone/C-terminal processing protease CtpA/Prc